MTPIYLAHISEDAKREQTLIEHAISVKDICEHHGRKLGLRNVAGLTGLLHDVGKYSERFQTYLHEGGERGSVKHSFVGVKLLNKLFDELLGVPAGTPNSLLFKELISNPILAHHSQLKDMRNTEGSSPYLYGVHTEESYVQIEVIYDRFLTDLSTYLHHATKEETLIYLRTYFIAAYKEVLHFWKATYDMSNSMGEERSQALTTYVPFVSKMLYSILIDADRTDTAAFMYNQVVVHRDNKPLMTTYQERLEEKLTAFKQGAGTKMLSEKTLRINQLRQKMSDDCKLKGQLPTGVYQLPIPTGGGKTLSSLRFALEHARIHKKERIIYVVPYTSIVEQNAREIRAILKDDANLFEHHSNVVYEPLENEKEEKTRRINKMLVEQTWDVPIVFTTAVQLLNTVYKNKGKYNRRLHNLSNAVIIFDEIQSLPQHTVKLFSECVNYLGAFANTTSVLCSATQPTFDRMQEHPIRLLSKDMATRNLTTLTESELAVFDRAKVVNAIETRGWDTLQLAHHLSTNVGENESCLVILNTKKLVKNLYTYLTETYPDKEVYYLTTNLCAKHRQDCLKRIRARLAAGIPIVCISTSLIEAGVDISFSVVYRALTGLDSIAQSVGRCNRHGEMDAHGRVYIFLHNEDTDGYFQYTRLRKQTTQLAIKMANGHSFLSKASLDFYFNRMLRNTVDMVKIGGQDYALTELLFAKNDRFNLKKTSTQALGHFALYQTFGEAFRVIDTNTYTVLVPYGKTVEELVALPFNQQQHYAVNVYENQFTKFLADGLVVAHAIGEHSLVYVLNKTYYSDEFGIFN